MFQYILLSLFGVFSLGSSFFPNQLYTTSGFEGRYYTNNTMGRYAHIGTTEKHRFNSYLRVYTSFKFFDAIAFNMSMQGWATKDSGFINGQGGGRWGLTAYLNKCGSGLLCAKFEVEHYSGHTFDNNNLAGSYDYIGFTLEYNSINNTKGLLGWL